MHSRIKLINDREVEIIRNKSGNISYFKIIHSDELHINDEVLQSSWDLLGSEAKNLVETCWRQTGSFAALSDESDGEFEGKVMNYRQSSGNDFPVRLLIESEHIKGAWHCMMLHNGAYINTNCLYPLAPPAPKIRPYTPEEAAAHLGRKFKNAAGYDARFIVNGVSRNAITYGETTAGDISLSLKSFASDCVWDDGSPCGVIEEPRA